MAETHVGTFWLLGPRSTFNCTVHSLPSILLISYKVSHQSGTPGAPGSIPSVATGHLIYCFSDLTQQPSQQILQHNQNKLDSMKYRHGTNLEIFQRFFLKSFYRGPI